MPPILSDELVLKDREGYENLRQAISTCDLEKVKVLLKEKGCVPVSRGCQTFGALHLLMIASGGGMGEPKLSKGVSSDEEYLKILEVLTSYGASFDETLNDGRTPLMIAGMYSYSQKVSDEFVVREKTLSSTDVEENTALHYAVKGSNLELVKSLLKRGANVNAENHLGYKPIDFCLERMKEDSDLAADPEIELEYSFACFREDFYKRHVPILKELLGAGSAETICPELQKQLPGARAVKEFLYLSGWLDILL